MDGDIRKKKILVVEDRKPMSKALAIKLERAGFGTQVADDGESALKLLEGNSFDLVLLDLVIPKMDGFTVLAEMQARSIKTPAIVLSNLSQEEDERRARELGAIDYFVKSEIAINEVVRRVSQVFTSNKNSAKQK